MTNKNTNKKIAAKRTACPAQPEINDMSDKEFEKYLDAQKNEDTPSESDKSTDAETKESREDIKDDVSADKGKAYGQESGRSFEDGRRQILDRWFADTERLKKEVPDFDLNEAMKNEEFRNLVISGMSVDGAYYALKYKELTKNPRRPIMQNASSRALKSGSSMNDMLSMNDGDFRKRLKSIMNDG